MANLVPYLHFNPRIDLVKGVGAWCRWRGVTEGRGGVFRVEFGRKSSFFLRVVFQVCADK